jgi:hypothetical protein
VPDIDMYWLNDRPVPFATFLNVIQTYYHSEVRSAYFSSLVRRAQRQNPGDVEMVTFKEELSRLLEGDREDLPPDALSIAAEYEDQDSDEEFLVWLWQHLYPSEPLPGDHASAPMN